MEPAGDPRGTEAAQEGAARPAAIPAPLPPGSAGAVPESGGPTGPEPTRYGDWERKGRCIDF